MTSMSTYRIWLSPEVDLAEAEDTLRLSMFAAEGLYGAARVLLAVRYEVVSARRTILIDATTREGVSVARIFSALALREFGEGSMAVSRPASATARAIGRRLHDESGPDAP